MVQPPPRPGDRSSPPAAARQVIDGAAVSAPRVIDRLRRLPRVDWSIVGPAVARRASVQSPGGSHAGAGLGEINMTDVYIVGAARTPIGRFLGGFSSVSAPELGAVAVRAALERAGVDPAAVEDVVIGNVVQAGVGQAPARQAALAAGIPSSSSAT